VGTETVSTFGSVAVLLAAIVTAWLTRRSAKDETAITGYAGLVERLQAQSDRDSARITALEDDRAEQRRLARRHEQWDWQLVRRVRELTDDPFPDPPPLDTEVTR
jgi:hypothetical protein